MFDKILDLFMRFRFSKWWYLLIIIFIISFNKILSDTKRESKLKYERIEKTILTAFLIPLCIIIVLAICLFLYSGFSGDLANDLSMVMITILGIILLFIPLIYKFYKFTQKRK